METVYAMFLTQMDRGSQPTVFRTLFRAAGREWYAWWIDDVGDTDDDAVKRHLELAMRLSLQMVNLMLTSSGEEFTLAV